MVDERTGVNGQTSIVTAAFCTCAPPLTAALRRAHLLLDEAVQRAWAYRLWADESAGAPAEVQYDRDIDGKQSMTIEEFGRWVDGLHDEQPEP